MELYQLCKICDQGGDLSARWFVEYKFKHPETNQFVKFREWISNKLLTRSARYAKATEYRNTLNIKLKSGYNPFETRTRNLNLIDAFAEILQIKEATAGTRTKSTYKSISKFFCDWLVSKKYQNLKPAEFNKYKAQEFLDLTDEQHIPFEFKDRLLFFQNQVKECFSFLLTFGYSLDKVETGQTENFKNYFSEFTFINGETVIKIQIQLNVLLQQLKL